MLERLLALELHRKLIQHWPQGCSDLEAHDYGTKCRIETTWNYTRLPFLSSLLLDELFATGLWLPTADRNSISAV